MPRKCYFGCINDSPLHHFPKPKSQKLEDIEKFSVWRAVLDVATQERGKTYIYNHILFCNKHFWDGYQLPSRRLTKNAVPTLNLVFSGNKTSTIPTDNESMPSTTELDPLEMSPAKQVEQPSTSTIAIKLDRDHDQLSPVESVPVQPVITTIQKYPIVHNQLSSVESVPVQPSMTTTHKNPIGNRKLRDSIIIYRLKKKLERITLKYKNQRKQIQAAKKTSKITAFQSIIEKLPDTIKTFTKLQLKSVFKPRGRKYTNDEKTMALTIFKQSPKAYEILEKMFVLPSKRSLQALLHSYKVKAGINQVGTRIGTRYQYTGRSQESVACLLKKN
ncbi:unnamed protein product [Colias eurytheme]|nr:unnamed protein product [Colias eurytheme]